MINKQLDLIQYKIFPNQKGELKIFNELKYDNLTYESYKDIAESLSIRVRELLLSK